MVDLEALKAELEAAGWTCEFYGDPTYGISIKGTKKTTPTPGWRSWLTVQNDGALYVYGRFWPAIDIIRRHIAPPEPVVLTAEEQRSLDKMLGWFEVDATDVLGWFAEHGFAIVRTKAVAE